jgi:GNAT superfamily N-acetyltransferase
MQNGEMEANGGEASPRLAAFVEAKVGDLSAQQVEDVYRRLLEPSFRPEELMSLQDFRSDYEDDAADLSSVLLVAGEPIAVMLGEWYAGGRVLLLGYLAVLEEARGTGAGSFLMRSVLPRWYADVPGALVIAEVDDPRSWSTDSHRGDPVGRLRFYERHGASLLPFAYFQPSLRVGSPRVRGMFLLRLDASPHVPHGILTEFLTEYFTLCEGPEAVNDPEVARLLSSAAAVDLTTGTWPVSRWHEVPTE